MPEALWPLVALAPILLFAGASDLRHMRIPNALSLAALALFALCATATPPADLLARLLTAGVVFALGFAAFCLRLFGGGDVKLLAALMLFVPTALLPLFGLIFSAALLAGIALLLALRRIPALNRVGWRSLARGNHFPMGISIALAGLALPPTAVLLAGRLPL
jgi:prepilin peptidase CpaA